MSVAPLNEYLDSFRSRTKLRGDSFQEKLETFLTRLEKVALDCEASLDVSPYRTNYGKIHMLEFENLKTLSQADLIKYLDYLKSHLQEIHDKYVMDYGVYDFEVVGTVDGLCYIVVELEEVLK